MKTVKELIEFLKTQDPELRVAIGYDSLCNQNLYISREENWDNEGSVLLFSPQEYNHENPIIFTDEGYDEN